MCSGPRPVHCNNVQGKMQCPLLRLVSLQLHDCIAGLFRARCNSHSSVLLCKTGSHQAVCHSRFTNGNMVFIQVCSGPPQMPCSSVQGKLQSQCLVVLCNTGQISIGVIAVAPAFSEPVLQSCTEQWGCYSALTNAAVLWCCITSHLHEDQISIGVIAVTQCILLACFAEQH